MAVKITQDRVAVIEAGLRALTRDRVLVGIPGENAARDPDKGESEAPLNNAEIGYIHEFGSPAANIPARPFLRPGIENAREDVIKRLKRGALAALQGDRAGIDRAIHGAGQSAANHVVEKITDGPFVPLAPMTLRIRQEKGRTGEKPLLDTGQLRRAVTYVIESQE